MKSNELIRRLKRDGWVAVSQEGSHIKMRHPTKPETLLVPNHGANEQGKGLARKILKKAGLL